MSYQSYDKIYNNNTLYGKIIKYINDAPIDYSKEYFFIEDVSGEENVLTIPKQSTLHNTYVSVSVSTDKINWVDLGSTETQKLTYQIPANGKLYIKGINDRWGSDGNDKNSINCSKYFNVGGNVMSLLYGDDFINKYTLEYEYVLCGLFSYSKVVDASKLVLPATTLSNFCYYYMFSNCASLMIAPNILPSNTLTRYCYGSMFWSCTNLTKAPQLPATTLANYCYGDMFNGCTSLIESPVLPATTLANDCYFDMFKGCTSLIESPVLPATTLANECYFSMFNGCTSLNKVVTYATNISASICLTSWLYNVSPTGDFYNLGGVTYPSGTSGIPEGWTEHKQL